MQELLECPEAEVDVNHADINHQTSLWWASAMGYLPVVELLLNDSSIDVNGERRARSTRLYIAAHKRYLDVVQALLAHPQGQNSIEHFWLEFWPEKLLRVLTLDFLHYKSVQKWVV